jgi:hypothetical protein
MVEQVLDRAGSALSEWWSGEIEDALQEVGEELTPTELATLRAALQDFETTHKYGAGQL